MSKESKEQNPNHYEVLGVAVNATQKEIKAEYRRLMLKEHPDKNIEKEAEANEKTKRIVEAYEILKNPIKKRHYDQTLEVGAKKSNHNKTTCTNPSNTRAAPSNTRPAESKEAMVDRAVNSRDRALLKAIIKDVHNDPVLLRLLLDRVDTNFNFFDLQEFLVAEAERRAARGDFNLRETLIAKAVAHPDSHNLQMVLTIEAARNPDLTKVLVSKVADDPYFLKSLAAKAISNHSFLESLATKAACNPDFLQILATETARNRHFLKCLFSHPKFLVNAHDPRILGIFIHQTKHERSLLNSFITQTEYRPSILNALVEQVRHTPWLLEALIVQAGHNNWLPYDLAAQAVNKPWLLDALIDRANHCWSKPLQVLIAQPEHKPQILNTLIARSKNNPALLRMLIWEAENRPQILTAEVEKHPGFLKVLATEVRNCRPRFLGALLAIIRRNPAAVESRHFLKALVANSTSKSHLSDNFLRAIALERNPDLLSVFATEVALVTEEGNKPLFLKELIAIAIAWNKLDFLGALVAEGERLAALGNPHLLKQLVAEALYLDRREKLEISNASGKRRSLLQVLVANTQLPTTKGHLLSALIAEAERTPAFRTSLILEREEKPLAIPDSNVLWWIKMAFIFVLSCGVFPLFWALNQMAKRIVTLSSSLRERLRKYAASKNSKILVCVFVLFSLIENILSALLFPVDTYKRLSPYNPFVRYLFAVSMFFAYAALFLFAAPAVAGLHGIHFIAKLSSIVPVFGTIATFLSSTIVMPALTLMGVSAPFGLVCGTTMIASMIIISLLANLLGNLPEIVTHWRTRRTLWRGLVAHREAIALPSGAAAGPIPLPQERMDIPPRENAIPVTPVSAVADEEKDVQDGYSVPSGLSQKLA